MMLYRSSIGTITILAALCISLAESRAWDDAKIPTSRVNGARSTALGVTIPASPGETVSRRR